MSNPTGPQQVGDPDTGDRRLPAQWHVVQWAQLTVTCLFCLLLPAAMISKGCAAVRSPASPLGTRPTSAAARGV